jgi:hypothetical protein
MRRPLSAALTYMRRHHVALLALFVALGGTSYAAVKIQSPVRDGTIHGCYVKRTGALRVLTTKSCRKSETTITWPSTGAAGPVGAPGLPGAAGAVTAGDLAPAEAWHEVGAASPTDNCAAGASGAFCGLPCFGGSNCLWMNAPGGGHTTAAFYRDPYGVVHLKGVVTSGAAAHGGTLGVHDATVFLLPPGDRPEATWGFATLVTDYPSSTSLAEVDVTAQGAVTLVKPTTAAIVSLSLDGITFRATG